MNCTTFEIWLQETSGDADRTPPQSLNAHLAECAGCRARWASEQTLDRAVVSWRRVPFPLPPTEPVVAVILSEQVRGTVPDADGPKRSRTRVPGARDTRTAVIAVTVAAAMLLIIGWTLRQDAPSQTPVAQQTPALPVTESVAALWNDVGTTSRAMARDTVQSLDQWSQFAAPVAVPTGPVEPVPLPAAPRWLPWSEPIGENLNTGFGFLSDVVPMPSAG